MMNWHIAETREQARDEAVHGLHRWHNEYNVGVLGRPGARHYDDGWELMDQLGAAGAAVIGTPDDLVAAIRELIGVTGGFGTVVGFAHDWANLEATRRSWDLVARYVIPEINDELRNLRQSASFLVDNHELLMGRASEAVMEKIRSTPGAYDALKVTLAKRSAKPGKAQQEWRPGADVTIPDAGR
jgi:limonene 1,2-monooxygenase